MDAQTGTPLTPLYSREPPAAAATKNPSAASVGTATAGAPPTVGLARNLFLPPRMTTPTGGVASAPSRAAAAPSKLPNAAGSKKGKNIREEEGGGRLRELEGEEEACRAADWRGVYRSAGELTR
ncbi:hypothetical protein D1007_46912 [Hordeum vulgare]|nr:hypothetical protein D1007_46912 [Hordeum vulgare]